ncbi:MAG TPA: hypothetical protein VNB90_12915 [Cytophagaceae bacterium]|jgi:hypothetical protein|nr:hypothetical protein [Cytophagaceae bacterium]
MHAFCQDTNGYIHDPGDDTLSEDEIAIVRKQTWASGFTQTLNKIGDPSIASFFFSDKTFNTNHTLQKKNFVLNTTIQPIVGIGGKRWYIKNYVHTFQVLPSIGIRIFQNDSSFHDHSLPVRTPNFMAKLNYFFSHAKLWNDSSRYKIYFGITGFHYSNGQDGYEFIVGNNGKDSVINTYNGNFSETAVMEFMTGGMRIFNKGLKPSQIKDKATSPRRLQYDSKNSLVYWKLGYEYHPKIFSSDKFQRYNLYGRHRMNLQLGYLINPSSRHVVYSKRRQKWLPIEKDFHNREVRRFVINVNYILDGQYNIAPLVSEQQSAPFLDVAKRMNIDFTWYERIGTVSDYAVFMRVGYYGSDPYNIYFRESIFVARVGIAFGNFAYGERK